MTSEAFSRQSVDNFSEKGDMLKFKFGYCWGGKELQLAPGLTVG